MDIGYLNDERIKLWKKVSEIELALKSKSSEIEVEIRDHAAKIKEYYSQIQIDAETISTKRNESESISQHLDTLDQTTKEISAKISAEFSEINALREKASTLLPEIEGWRNAAQIQYAEIQTVYANNPVIVAQLRELDSHHEKGKDLSSKIEEIYKSANARKGEIDELYYEIYGYVETDTTINQDTKVKGLKDELEETYRQLKSNFATQQNLTVNSINELQDRITEFESVKNSEIKNLIDSWSKEYSNIKVKIENLLPNALTTGLSYAYSDKKKQEVEESQDHATAFKWAILGMIGVSFIPMGISVQSLLTGISLNDTILRLPRLVLAILPLYIPVLWIAASSNRKGNLSKRLIEEYSHKEALSKTYEGLSTQIDSLGDSEATRDLRLKLLYNILEVSSENPGKLISNYNKSDHPVMEALDKSVQLTNSVEKLTRIPGFSKLANILANKAEIILDKQSEKAEKGLETTET